MGISRSLQWWRSVVAIVVVAAGLSVALASFYAWAFARNGYFPPLLFLFVTAVLLYATFRERAPLFGLAIYRGNRHRQEIAITFDDGPSFPYTCRILDILRERGVIAAFFVVGERVKSSPDLIRRALTEGHTVGNHTYTHQILPLKGPSVIRREIEQTEEAIVSAAGGFRPRLFRAPHGWRNPFVNPIVRRCGYLLVAWTLGVWDTDCPGTEEIVGRSLSGLRNGCILLLHDGGGDRHQTVDALPAIIDGARRRGYRIVPLERLIDLS